MKGKKSFDSNSGVGMHRPMHTLMRQSSKGKRVASAGLCDYNVFLKQDARELPVSVIAFSSSCHLPEP